MSSPVHPGQTSTPEPEGQSPLPWATWLVVGFLVVLCGALTFSGTFGQDIFFDEEVDHSATLVLSEDPLLGSGTNGSQARLPHYASLLAYRAAEMLGFDGMQEYDISIARAVSSVAIALTVLVTFLIGRRVGGTPSGLLSAATLAVAPYFLGFGGLAYTNGDAFCPLFVTTSIWAYLRYTERPSGPRLAALTAAIGLAIATKFIMVPYLFGLVLCDFFTCRRSLENNKTPKPILLLVISISSFFLAIGTAVATQLLARESHENGWSIRVSLWLASLILTFLGLIQTAKLRESPVSFLARWTIVLPLAAGITLTWFPEHVLHPETYGEMYRLTKHLDGSRRILDLRQTAFMYGGVIAIKLGVPLGLCSAIALLWSCLACIRSAAIRAPFLVLMSYGFFLASQPLKQTFHNMPIYPSMIIILSAFMVYAYRALKPRVLRTAAALVIAVSYGWLLIGVVRVFPHFQLYGYETIGPSWRGYETRGYLSLFFIDQDGNRETLEWCKANLPAKSRVVSALRLLTSVDRIMKETPHELDFVQLDWPWLRKPEADWEAIRTGDYLILHLNNHIHDRATPSFDQIATVFEREPLHTISIGRGVYQIDLVKIYKRRADQPATLPPDGDPSKP